LPSYVSEKLLGYISGFSVVASQLSGFESPNIREAIANREYTNHQTQMQNAQQIVDFLSGNAIGGGVPDKGDHCRLLHLDEA